MQSHFMKSGGKAAAKTGKSSGKSAGKKPKNGNDELVLTDKDEKILDRAWESIVKGGKGGGKKTGKIAGKKK